MMRLFNYLRVLLLLLLALGLIGGELGESFRLADDVSNDYVQVSASPAHKCVEIVFQSLISQESVAIAQELPLSFPVLPSSAPSFYP